jgi:hypothetical protein
VINIRHLLLLPVGSLFFFLYSCKQYNRNSKHKDIPVSSIEKGEVLATRHCQSCHLLPDPSLLDTKSWEKGVLPNMGPRLGIFAYDFEMYPSSKHDKNIDSNYYPSRPVLSFNDWQNIIDYYIATSPDSLPKQIRQHPIQYGISTFSVQYPQFAYESPNTLSVEITNAGSFYPLVISDVFKQNIYFFDKQLAIKDSVHCSGPIVDIDSTQNGLLACNIGILNPNDRKTGTVQTISFTPDGKMQEARIPLFDSLRRPVGLVSADMNNDNKTDYVICEFGNLVGALSWFENLGNDKFERHVLRAFPGAIKAYVNDYNHDGANDIWVLFSQGEEGIFLFTNNGRGVFSEKEVLRFPPVYGSSSFELADFNKDGHVDIVYTCGDNADYSIVLKPYHGVYVFLNDGKNNFKQKFFYPINGCFKALARDFDNDGDLDIATIAFFADYKNQPEEGFVYLQQKSDFVFTPYSLPECKSGRWLTMDAGDIDGDGAIDLVLGNFSIRPSDTPSATDWTKGPMFLILKNTGK